MTWTPKDRDNNWDKPEPKNYIWDGARLMIDEDWIPLPESSGAYIPLLSQMYFRLRSEYRKLAYKPWEPGDIKAGVRVRIKNDEELTIVQRRARVPGSGALWQLLDPKRPYIDDYAWLSIDALAEKLNKVNAKRLPMYEDELTTV